VNALVAKEARLLLPAYVTALLLAFVPRWFMPEELAIALMAFGAVMLALSPFGREFGMSTFSLILAQPLDRQRIWNTKIVLLATGMITVFVAWCLAWFAGTTSPGPGHMFIFGATIIPLAFAGGLWTTLLFRQIASAFWFCILVPVVLQMIVVASDGSETVSLVCLAAYCVAGFHWSRRYFLRMQETAWTGGEVSLTGWHSDAARQAVRSPKPLMAFFRKELQLHQFNLLGIALLFVFHFVVVFLRKAGHGTFSPATQSGLHVFGGLWLIVPFIVGSASLAEERKLGTMEAHLCLPLSRRAQFVGKLLVVVVIGALLPTILAWIPESVGLRIGVEADVQFVKTLFNDPQTIGIWFLICFGLSLAGFYGSSLSRGTVQALAIGLLVAFAGFSILKGADDPENLLGLRLWDGPLVYYILPLALLAVGLWLAWRNFAFLPEAKVVWRRNLLSWLAALFVSFSLTVALYHRVWEFFGPIEPAHGPARIAGVGSARLVSRDYVDLAAVLPDGEFWLDKVSHRFGRLHLAFGEGTGFCTGGKFVHLSGSHTLPGSNWLDGAVNYNDTVGIRSDGTLWVSETPNQWSYPNWSSQTVPQMVQFGEDRNWQRVLNEFRHSFVLLKRDGTLWHWGTNDFNDKLVWPGLKAFTPMQIGHDSDWAEIVGGPWNFYGWKKDGSAWNFSSADWRAVNSNSLDDSRLIGDRLKTERCSFLDNSRWRGFADQPWHRIGLREDGTLWIWPTFDPNNPTRLLPPKLTQIGRDSDWALLAADWQSVTALRKDGTLWKWPAQRIRNRETSVLTAAPVRLGSHSDWAAITTFHGGTVSLAADGGLWLWLDDEHDSIRDQPMLRASRKPVLIENTFSDPSH
jgi:hypothetical protein